MMKMESGFSFHSNDWLTKFDEPRVPTKVPKKEVLHVSQLQGRTRLVIDHYKRLYQDHTGRASHISGRSLEMIFSKLSKTRYGYYVWRDAAGVLQCSDEFCDESELFFDVGASYQCMLSLLGKTFFDTFQRGIIIEFEESMEVSVCSLFFDRWCTEFGLFEMVDRLNDRDVVVRVPVHHREQPYTFQKLVSVERYKKSSGIKFVPLVIDRRPSFMYNIE